MEYREGRHITLREQMTKVLKQARNEGNPFKGQHDFQKFSRYVYQPTEILDGSFIKHTLNKLKTDEELEETYARWQIERGEET